MPLYDKHQFASHQPVHQNIKVLERGTLNTQAVRSERVAYKYFDVGLNGLNSEAMPEIRLCPPYGKPTAVTLPRRDVWLGNEVVAGGWTTPAEGDLRMCANGYHVAPLRHVAKWVPGWSLLFRVETTDPEPVYARNWEGKLVRLNRRKHEASDGKWVYRSYRLLAHITPDQEEIDDFIRTSRYMGSHGPDISFTDVMHISRDRGPKAELEAARWVASLPHRDIKVSISHTANPAK